MQTWCRREHSSLSLGVASRPNGVRCSKRSRPWLGQLKISLSTGTAPHAPQSPPPSLLHSPFHQEHWLDIAEEIDDLFLGDAEEHWLDIAEEIDNLFLLGDADVWRRPTSGTHSPTLPPSPAHIPFHQEHCLDIAEEIDDLFLLGDADEHWLDKAEEIDDLFLGDAKEHWLDIAEEIDDLFLGDAEVWRRPTSGTAGPLGGEFPLVTENGHFVLDVIFTTPIADMSE
ncbi:unnamed protein product [Closterium sp. NIES-65]|nr:unnamed protein product [Closterium sp. NIES-65]